MNINTQYISTQNTYSTKNKKKYIVIHETDNFKNGADGLRHAKAQFNGNLSTSVHFYCGSDGVYQTASLDRCVWAVGKTYKKMPITDASNYNTINIEICVNEDGDYNVARQNAIELVKYLMNATGIPADRVIRHYDAKGKHCPRKMMDNLTLWDNFKLAILGKEESKATNTSKINEKVLEWQKSAIADGFKFALYGADGKWGSECEGVAEKLIVKKRIGVYKYKNATKIVQKAVGVTVDGLCGAKTNQAIRNYQAKNGLVVDGCVGVKTWKKILGV